MSSGATITPAPQLAARRWVRWGLRLRRPRRRKPISVRAAVSIFALASLTAVVVIGFAGVEVLKGRSAGEAIGDAKELTRLAGRGIVQPVVSDGLLKGDRGAVARVDRVVRRSVLGRGIVRIKIWTAGGRIVYSDAAPLIGSTYPLTRAEIASLRSGQVVADRNPSLVAPENRYERSTGSLIDIYLPIHTPSGVPLLFETYLPSGEISASAHRLWVAFAPALLGGLGLLALIQLPLAWSLASHLRRRQEERAALLTKAAEASEDERRRIARDLHDGLVQDLAGVVYTLDASAEVAPSQPPTSMVPNLRAAADQTRQCIRGLRSLLVEIYPPNLRSAGLASALSDLVSTLSNRGIDAHLQIAPDLKAPEEVEAVVYRVAQEAVRNVAAHSKAKHAVVDVQREQRSIRLTVSDDGVGFAPEEARRRGEEGHVGLAFLADFVREAGGRLEISSQPGEGTRVRLEMET